MQSSDSSTNSNNWVTRTTNLMSPDSHMLVNVLEDGLRRSFFDVNVEWVTCPDLSQEPFNLAAPGLCGKTAFIEIGHKSAWTDPKGTDPIKEPIKFPIKEIIKFLNRDSRDSFIFGSGDYSDQRLILNTSFSPKTKEEMLIKNKSHIVSANSVLDRCNLIKIMDADLHCSKHGTFFLCEGLTGPVLEVRAQKYRSNELHPFLGFIDSMQNALNKMFDIKDPHIVLGGVYIVKNVQNWSHKLQLSKELSNEFSPRYCDVNVPEVTISIFNSNKTGTVRYSGVPPMELTCQSKCSLSHDGVEKYNADKAITDDIEFLGYFCPAEMVYQLGDPRIY